MAKLCAKGKAAAKRKFKVYPSAYANMYASAVCSGKIKPGGKTQKKADGGLTRTTPPEKGPNPQGLKEGNLVSQRRKRERNPKGVARGCGAVMNGRRKVTKYV